MKSIICWVDGGYNNVKKTNGYGSFLIRNGEEDILKRFLLPEANSSNEAEYLSLLKLLDELYALVNWVWKQEKISVIIKSDSQLMVNQIKGTWKVNSQRLVELNHKCLTEIKDIEISNVKLKLQWINREENVIMLGH